MHRNIVQHICIAASKLKYARNIIFFPISQLDVYFKPIALRGKNKSLSFQDEFLDIFLVLHLRTRGMHRAEVLGLCVDSWPYVITQPCCHLLSWPLFCWVTDFIYRLVLPYCTISSLRSHPDFLLLLSYHAGLSDTMGG